MNSSPGEAREHARVIEAVKAALLVQRVVGRPARARAEQPPQTALHSSTGLIEMRDWCLDELGVNVVQEPLKIFGAAGHKRGERPGRERRTDPVAEHLGGTRIRQMLVGQEVICPAP
jgi:hypothetical protein